MSETIIIEHPFFDDYAEAFQSVAVKELGAEGRERLKEVQCALFPSSYLTKRWQGWEIGIPRPAELIPKEVSKKVLEQWHRGRELFLRDFFKNIL